MSKEIARQKVHDLLICLDVDTSQCFPIYQVFIMMLKDKLSEIIKELED